MLTSRRRQLVRVAVFVLSVKRVKIMIAVLK